MPRDFLPGKRYVVRELIPRAVLLTLVFKFVFPLIPFALFQFDGGFISAAAFGTAFTAMFCLLGSYLMGAPAVMMFMEKHKKAFWFIPANIAFVLGFPALALTLAAFIAPSVFSMSGWLSAIVGSVILNIACALTHDYRSN